MPADGKTPLSKEEAAIIKWWVEKAATGEDKNFISVNPTEEIKKYAAAYLTIGTEESAADVRVSVVVPPLRKETVEELKRAGFSVKYLHFKPDLLDVSLPSGTKDASGKVRSLLQARENIVWLNLSGNSLSDGDLGLINQLTNLEKLKIDNNTITDKGVEKLSGLKALKSINLYNTGVSKDCLSFLQNLPALKRAYVWGTAIKEEDVIPFTSKIQVVTGN
jgi:Leucine-rich repeat (LRR) protein